MEAKEIAKKLGITDKTEGLSGKIPEGCKETEVGIGETKKAR